MIPNISASINSKVYTFKIDAYVSLFPERKISRTLDFAMFDDCLRMQFETTNWLEQVTQSAEKKWVQEVTYTVGDAPKIYLIHLNSYLPDSSSSLDAEDTASLCGTVVPSYSWSFELNKPKDL